MLIRPLTHPQAADVAPAQPDAQAEAPQRKACPTCGENELGCKQFGCWSAPRRTIDTSDAEPWPDEVFTAPADDVPVDREGE